LALGENFVKTFYTTQRKMLLVSNITLVALGYVPETAGPASNPIRAARIAEKLKLPGGCMTKGSFLDTDRDLAR
jgi:hypothetical protein